MSSKITLPVIRLIALGLAAVGFAALAVVMVNRHVNDSIERQKAASRVVPPATIQVVVAKFDLIAGEVIGPDNMAIRPIPADLAPSSALRPDQFDSKVGMKLVRALRSGEPVLSEILQAAEVGGLSARVKQGIRALTIAVDDVNAVSGMLRPGDRIDLLFSAKAPGTDSTASVETTRVLVQDVAVLATGRQFRQASDESAARPFTSITVELSPEDAKRMVVAQRAGRITALLRNPDDRHAVSLSAVDAHALLGVHARQSAPTTRPTVSSGPEMIIGGGGSLATARAQPLPDPDRTVARPVASGASSLASNPPAPSASPAQGSASAGATAWVPPTLSQPLLIR
jgi:pilus assembly protein CpaB